jgi:hypothetical protein
MEANQISFLIRTNFFQIFRHFLKFLLKFSFAPFRSTASQDGGVKKSSNRNFEKNYVRNRKKKQFGYHCPISKQDGRTCPY